MTFSHHFAVIQRDIAIVGVTFWKDVVALTEVVFAPLASPHQIRATSVIGQYRVSRHNKANSAADNNKQRVWQSQSPLALIAKSARPGEQRLQPGSLFAVPKGVSLYNLTH